MTKEEAQQVWAAASEYRWRGFDHWWEVEGSRGRPPLYTPVPTSCREFENVDIGIYDNKGMITIEGSKGRPASHEEGIEWIDISKPPEKDRRVLVYLNNNHVDIWGWVEGIRCELEHDFDTNPDDFKTKDYFLKYVTHWAELPKGPKEGSKVELDREAIAESKIDTETFVDMVEKRISKNKQQINNEADRLYFDAIWRAKNE